MDTRSLEGRGWRTHVRCIAATALSMCLMCAGVALAQEAYLEDVASDPASTRGEARLLHWLADDMPIEVYVEPVERADADAVRDTVVAAFEAWQDAAPDLVQFRFLDAPSEGALHVRWERFADDRVGRYAYRFEVQESGIWRFRGTEVVLDPRHELSAMYRYAMLEAGHALGLLGRSPHAGDAMSDVPSGQVTERDTATLRALYEVPSGTVLDP